MAVQNTIEQKLSVLNPVHLSVDNESHMHSVPPNSETHFKVVLVSELFSGMRPVKRHQKVYGLLQEELSSGVHALALHIYTPEEWDGQMPESPACKGGNGK
ncbi:BolA family transcriptional regulator [Reinekea sp. G2M2-21]|uniref:BolA family protein n=1 Tax=Reinekea sp. G2M2-21 TaxID=2788942 RepID=UPI0018AACC53|nr:BolA/IbaG family iron-sulfur metabolism protein [Reinekea sp. G2M2-21]